MVYGASGFTGRLIVDTARARGLRPVLGGRRATRLEPAGAALDLEWRVAALDDPIALRAALTGIDVVVHAAGPFSATSRPMIDACLATGTHYLDVSGEIETIESAACRDSEARAAGVMIMPAVGFDVVPSDGLGAHVHRRLPRAKRLSFGVSGLVSASRGSVKTLLESAGAPILVRRDGHIRQAPDPTEIEHFDFGYGPCGGILVSWGDVASAWYTTGIPDVRVYFEATAEHRMMTLCNRLWGPSLATPPLRRWLMRMSDWLPDGPSRDDLELRETVIVATAEDGDGARATSRLTGPEAYRFTGLTAVAVAARVLEGDWVPGFQTPGRLYGPDFSLQFPEVIREDLD